MPLQLNHVELVQRKGLGYKLTLLFECYILLQFKWY